jgi:hypothetical protein
VCSSCASAGNATAPRPSSKLQLICQRARACARVMGSYNGCKMTLKIKPIRLAAQAQAPAAVRREDPSGRHLLGKGRTWKVALSVPRWIVNGAENGGWSCPDCRGPASALACVPRGRQG